MICKGQLLMRPQNGQIQDGISWLNLVFSAKEALGLIVIITNIYCRSCRL